MSTFPATGPLPGVLGRGPALGVPPERVATKRRTRSFPTCLLGKSMDVLRPHSRPRPYHLPAYAARTHPPAKRHATGKRTSVDESHHAAHGRTQHL